MRWYIKSISSPQVFLKTSPVIPKVFISKDHFPEVLFILKVSVLFLSLQSFYLPVLGFGGGEKTYKI